ncbi:MAG: roadblock/LC7 domain-containing protein [Deltaproteobacteria bacterium]|nr:roadblock/LC7 domain-containing protein [Deltaproteobacteria bacterium]MBW2137314.1 roadblock/LC7 domain-containing protein [Deltaproteobacteria bacterium]
MGGQALTFTLSREQLDAIDEILRKEIFNLRIRCVLLIDMAGNVISNINDGKIEHDVHSLAALAAGNFGAVSTMAKMIGEDEFSLLFHKGEKENIHFSKVLDDFLLITIFGKDLSLGFLRLKVGEAIEKVERILAR